MTRLRISADLSLPLDAVTQTLLVVGKRGSGKSSTATRLAEQLVAARVQIAVLDPADVWWGLKAGRDGSREGGLDIYVFGGAHADLPLEPTAGVLMADVLVDHRVNAVMVLREFSNRDKAHFVSDFAERLYRRMTGEFVLHLFCEEAHELMPQQPYKGEEEMLGRMLRLEKQGRTGGIGMSAITQRPASLNKNATTQAEILVAHRLLGPQDIAAVEGWIKHHHVEAAKQQVLATLPELKTGEAWVWAPDFPEEKPIGLRRVHVLMPETFDSRRTPKPGERRAEPKELVPVDLEKLRSKMAATIERAKAEDPKALRARIRELEAKFNHPAVVTKPEPPKIERVEIPVLKNGELSRLALAASKLEQAGTRLEKAADTVKAASFETRQAGASILGMLQLVVKAQSAPSAVSSTGDVRRMAGSALAQRPASPRDGTAVRAARPMEHRPPWRSVPAAQLRGREQGATRTDERLPSAQQRILDAAAFLESLGDRAPDVVRLALVAGQSASGGYWRANIGRLRTLGLIEGTMLTEEGRALARPPAISTTAELHRHVFENLLEGAQKQILQVLIDAHPEDLSIEETGRRAKLSPDGGYWRACVGRLRSLGLVSKRGPLRALPALFIEEAARA